MKYIIFQCDEAVPTCRIFDEITNHSDVVREVQSQSPGLKVISAGKCRHDEGHWTCINGSVTLGLAFKLERSQIDEGMLDSLSKSY